MYFLFCVYKKLFEKTNITSEGFSRRHETQCNVKSVDEYIYIICIYIICIYVYIYITYIMYIIYIYILFIYIYISPMPLRSYVHMHLSTWQNSTLKTHFILQIFCSHLGSFLCARNFTVLFKSNLTIFASNFTILLYIFVEWRVRE